MVPCIFKSAYLKTFCVCVLPPKTILLFIAPMLAHLVTEAFTRWSLLNSTGSVGLDRKPVFLSLGFDKALLTHNHVLIKNIPL